MVSRKTDILQQYAGILKHFSAASAGEAVELKNLMQSTLTAGNSVNSLSTLSSLFDQRLNVLVYFFLNSFLLYDIQLVRLLEKWKIRHKPAFPEWINSVGKIEMLVSIAVFRFNHPHFIFPVPVPGKPRIAAREVCHPLIPEPESIGNPVQAGDPEKMFLITGSNMSGKTTYLRTIGVSLVLAQCGAPVCAGSFVFTPLSLLTSIRVNDSLLDHTSYFMAELKQLRLIVDTLERGTPALVLVDEILRGTNSEDKNHGSEAFIRKLLHYEVLCFFATHDLSLGMLEQKIPAQVKNLCFESTLEEGELVFDYKLREGLAKNRNATFLMQKMGII
jgi:DNA mismatch repair ATPase MutS